MMKKIYAKGNNTIELGVRGENLATQVVFDYSEWKSLYGVGHVALKVQRATDTEPYPVPIRMSEDLAIWDVTSADTAIAGWGKAEYQYIAGDTLKKSMRYITYTADSLGEASATPPEPQRAWVDQVLSAGAAAQQAAVAAKADADRAATLAEEVFAKASQTAQDATACAQAKEAAQTAQRLAEAAKQAAETAKRAAETAQAAVDQSAKDAGAAKQGAESALSDAQAAASAAAQALSDIRALYQQMQTWAQGVIQTISDAGSNAVQSVEAAGDTQVQRVANEGAQQTANAKEQADLAAESASAARDALTKAPVIGNDGDWYVYDSENGQYVNTGWASRGAVGPQGEKGDPGPAGSDANVTAENIRSALGYTPADTSKLAEKITAPSTASIGQVICVKAVDENGKPIEWEAVDAPSGGSDLPVVSAKDKHKYLGIGVDSKWSVHPGQLSVVLDWYRNQNATENASSALVMMEERRADLEERKAILEEKQAEYEARRNELENKKAEFLDKYGVYSPDELDEEARAEYEAIVEEGEALIAETEALIEEAQVAVDEAEALVNDAQAIYDECVEINRQTEYALEACTEEMRSIVLPPVTYADNGKTLQVVDGKWALV